MLSAKVRDTSGRARRQKSSGPVTRHPEETPRKMRRGASHSIRSPEEGPGRGRCLDRSGRTRRRWWPRGVHHRRRHGPARTADPARRRGPGPPEAAGRRAAPSGGARGADRLRILARPSAADGAPIVGFAVVDGERTALLPYGPGNRGLGIEHHALMLPLLDILERRGDVEVRRRTRVSLLSRRAGRRGGHALPATAGPSGSAPGCWSPPTAAPRRSAARSASPSSTIASRRWSACWSTRARSRTPAAGHLFIGGPGAGAGLPHLGHPGPGDGGSAARLHARPGPRPSRTILSGVPLPLRQAILDALEREPPLVAATTPGSSRPSTRATWCWWATPRAAATR